MVAVTTDFEAKDPGPRGSRTCDVDSPAPHIFASTVEEQLSAVAPKSDGFVDPEEARQPVDDMGIIGTRCPAHLRGRPVKHGGRAGWERIRAQTGGR